MEIRYTNEKQRETEGTPPLGHPLPHTCLIGLPDIGLDTHLDTTQKGDMHPCTARPPASLEKKHAAIVAHPLINATHPFAYTPASAPQPLSWLSSRPPPSSSASSTRSLGCCLGLQLQLVQPLTHTSVGLHRCTLVVLDLCHGKKHSEGHAESKNAKS